MKKVVEDELTSRISVLDVATYGMQVYGDEAKENLWPRALKSTEIAKVPKQAMKQAGEAIRGDTDDAPGPSKRTARSTPATQSPPSLEVMMDEATNGKKPVKPHGPSYKLKSGIELGIDLKKVFKERILNSTVELSLGELLGIAKREFHDKFIETMKRR
ncbi:hypothetical protein L7F22_027973 [Adiantum nelumboides]|nr:hypothetical protein [Adiantum nelumboides]